MPCAAIILSAEIDREVNATILHYAKGPMPRRPWLRLAPINKGITVPFVLLACFVYFVASKRNERRIKRAQFVEPPIWQKLEYQQKAKLIA